MACAGRARGLNEAGTICNQDWDACPAASTTTRPNGSSHTDGTTRDVDLIDNAAIRFPRHATSPVPRPLSPST